MMSDIKKTRLFKIDSTKPDNALIKVAADAIRSGLLVAFPTETVYGLGANAHSAEAVGKIYAAKERPSSDPIIVHICNLAQLEDVAVEIPDLARKLASQFWPGPLTLVLVRHANVPSIVSAGLDTVAVRMPSHPVALALIQAANLPIAAPSANRFARPSATTADHVLNDLRDRVDIILDGGSATIGVESTILDLTGSHPLVLRPGGVTLEALRSVVPDVQLLSKYLDADDAGIVAPGMLLKHYSPRATLCLFSGDLKNVLSAMHDFAIQEISMGRRLGLLISITDQGHFADIPAEFFILGHDLNEISHNLFAGMRTLDAAGVDSILVHDFGRFGLGAALWDRLLRASEGRLIRC
ncbi:MAG: L-threonylcarbamoyladenylate synthase [Anaerolineae bacterium]